jgi:hypothetical protein
MSLIKELSDGNPDGCNMGSSTTEKIAFHGVTPIAQRSGSSQTALTLTTATTTGIGFSTVTAFNAFSAQLEEIRATLTALGFFAGS